MADVTPFLVGVLGAEPAFGAPSVAFRFGQWRFAGGGRLEILEPNGADSFLHRFLAQNGPGIHHATFKVPDLREACTRAEGHGYKIVGFDDSNPHWKEAFLHPKQALGIVVQIVQASRAVEGGPPHRWEPPPAPPDPPAPVTMLGLRLRVRSAERARLQWGQLLEGTETNGPDGALVYRWERSPLTLTVDVDPSADEGPLRIELASDRPVDLPAGRHPVLGAVFAVR